MKLWPLVLVLVSSVSCGKLGPECERLSECCEAMDEALGRQGCIDALEEHGTEEGAETYCRSAADILNQAGTCDSKPSGSDAGTPTAASCEALRQCCQEISSGPYRSDCLVAVGQMEVQPNGDASCRLSLQGYEADGWCGAPVATETEDDDRKCSDGIDNDQNGHLDCRDWACSRNPNVTVCRSLEGSDAACRDGADNDGDGFVDCDDYDCSRNPSVFVCG